MATTIQVSFAEFSIPSHAGGIPINPGAPLNGHHCGCGCSCGTCALPAAPPVPKVGGQSVRFGTGDLVLTADDLHSGGFGVPWGHSRNFASRFSENTDVGNGYNWQVQQWPYLVVGDDGSVAVMGAANDVLNFAPSGAGFVPLFCAHQTLTLDSVNQVYNLYELDGSVSQFSAGSGAFIRHSDPAGNFVAVVSRLANGFNPGEVQRSVTSGGVTDIESYLYDYIDPTATFPRLAGVTLRRSGSWNNVLRVVYAYYGAGDPNGGEGDLKTATTQTWNGSSWDNTGTTYYRYYLSLGAGSSSSSSGSSSSGSPGAAHLPKYVVLPSSYDRLVADGFDPLTVDDGTLGQYADHYFEFGADRKATKELLAGGSSTSIFFTETSGNADGYNSWKWKTTETRTDGSQNIVYSNYAGQTMLRVLQAGPDQWLDFYRYDDGGMMILHANPSAVSGFDEQYADLLHDVAGHYEFLRDNAGKIETFGYHAPTGYLASESVQQGQLGVSIKIREYEYAACCPSPSSSSSSLSSSSSGSSSAAAPAPCVYLLARKIEYPSDGQGSPGSSSSSSGPLPQIITSFANTFYPGTCAVQQRTTTWPVISAAQNGSGIAAMRRDYLDIYGNVTWQQDERGFLIRTSYDIATGAVTQVIQDVDTTRVSDAPPGWTTPLGGGLHLITDYEPDDEGRTTQILGPSHVIDIAGVATSVRTATWFVYLDAEHQFWTARGYAVGSGPDYTSFLTNPVWIAISDADGRTLESIMATRASTAGPLLPTDSFPQSSYVRWTTMQYGANNLVVSQSVYHTIPESGSGSSGTNYDESLVGYDLMQRQNRPVTPGGTITRTVFDVRNNALQIFIGTNDTGATDSDPTGGGAAGNNMVLVTENEFDGGAAGGDNNLTKITQHVDDTTTRVTQLIYDWRNRHVITDGEIDFYQKEYPDNLDRVTKTERYDTTAAGNLIARTESLPDDRNRIYQTIRYGVDPATGTVGNRLTDNTWFDDAGNAIKSLPAGSSLFTKFVIDGVGQQTKQYQGFNLSEAGYPTPGDVSNDIIFEQTETGFDEAGNNVQTTLRQRYHNATGTGELGTPSSAQPQARVTYQASWPDGIGRTTATAKYGTNGDAALSRPATVPTGSDVVLVTRMAYADSGDLQTITDPAGKVTFVGYDDAGRAVINIANYQPARSSSSLSSGSSGSSSGYGPCPPSDDKNVTVRKTYNPDGNIATLTVSNPATGDQTTQYAYGTTLADSSIASSLLKRADILPGSVAGSDQVLFGYNRQAEVVEQTDQTGTIREFDFDKLARPTEDRVTTLGAGVDGAVLRKATTYEVRGMIQNITQYDNATVGSGNVVDDVLRVYNNFAQLTTEFQSHSGAVDISTTPQVQYQYADGSANHIRQTALVYPNGRTLYLDYGTSGPYKRCTQPDCILDRQ